MNNIVLIVDNDTGIIEAFQQMLNRYHYTILSSSSPKEVLRIIALQKPEIVIFDMKFRGPLNIDFLRKIKKRYPSLPVVVMTTFSNTFTREHIMSIGVEGYFKMPFEVDEMLEKIWEYTGVLEQVS
jgi:DNA-binding NtrC family response regulator